MRFQVHGFDARLHPPAPLAGEGVLPRHSLLADGKLHRQPGALLVVHAVALSMELLLLTVVSLGGLGPW